MSSVARSLRKESPRRTQPSFSCSISCPSSTRKSHSRRRSCSTTIESPSMAGCRRRCHERRAQHFKWPSSTFCRSRKQHSWSTFSSSTSSHLYHQHRQLQWRYSNSKSDSDSDDDLLSFRPFEKMTTAPPTLEPTSQNIRATKGTGGRRKAGSPVAHNSNKLPRRTRRSQQKQQHK